MHQLINVRKKEESAISNRDKGPTRETYTHERVYMYTRAHPHTSMWQFLFHQGTGLDRTRQVTAKGKTEDSGALSILLQNCRVASGTHVQTVIFNRNLPHL